MQFQRDMYLAAAASSRDTTQVPRLTAPPYALGLPHLALEFLAAMDLAGSNKVEGEAAGALPSSNTDRDG
jgi:hypothetical protein